MRTPDPQPLETVSFPLALTSTVFAGIPSRKQSLIYLITLFPTCSSLISCPLLIRLFLATAQCQNKIGLILYVLKVFEKAKNIFFFCIISGSCDGADSWNHSSLKMQTCVLWSIPWLLMTWQLVLPGHQQSWYCASYPRILHSQPSMG